MCLCLLTGLNTTRKTEDPLVLPLMAGHGLPPPILRSILQELQRFIAPFLHCCSHFVLPSSADFWLFSGKNKKLRKENLLHLQILSIV